MTSDSAISTSETDRSGFFASRGLKLGIQLYTLGPEALKDIDQTLTKVAAIGYETIELPGLRAGTGVRTRTAAEAAGLTVTGVHVHFGPLLGRKMLTLEDDAGRLAAELHALECTDIVMPFPLMPPFDGNPGADLAAAIRRQFELGGADLWKRTAQLLNDRSEALRREGILLSYHNHNLEFVPIGDTNGWEILLAELDPLVTFEVDAGWIAAAGIDLVTFLHGLSGRVRQLHIKDIKGPKPGTALLAECTEVGSGVVKWKHVLPAAYRSGARAFFVEQEEPFEIDRFDAIAKSLDYLRQV